MKWICLTFRPPTGLPCFSYGSHASDGNIFTLKPLSPLTNRTIIEFCQELFGNAVIACEQNTGVPQVRFFYLNMAFGDLKARTGCNRLRDFHGGILFEGTHGTLIPLRYSVGTKDIIWRFHKGQVEQCENTRVLNCIAELPDWPGRDLKDPNRQATELIDEKRVLVCKYRPHTS
ncbi:hypothetical protein BDV32DRAFT_145580 [Aspergillus pseudonomiae]|uniref:Uncharacterized protein n=1 Tax=Aspergillus pseudonomiae TaxID=1506151 RepID=A0A5N6IC65_9EURO|nr:uncharacterized protein BDV37DRAFT_278152 [Aspergillus pseudonomiae]KAB8264332.1 hypothetical protein BDV32DRAFT_145580 [Aspergillus pseudonomiae]KAE8409183.1 hypothetical protein BDV37DRAFT_278152 [Aspergillus pseudonomiae]